MSAINLSDKGKFARGNIELPEQREIPVKRKKLNIKFDGDFLLNHPEGFNERNMNLRRKGMFGKLSMNFEF